MLPFQGTFRAKLREHGLLCSKTFVPKSADPLNVKRYEEIGEVGNEVILDFTRSLYSDYNQLMLGRVVGEFIESIKSNDVMHVSYDPELMTFKNIMTLCVTKLEATRKIVRERLRLSDDDLLVLRSGQE